MLLLQGMEAVLVKAVKGAGLDMIVSIACCAVVVDTVRETL